MNMEYNGEDELDLDENLNITVTYRRHDIQLEEFYTGAVRCTEWSL